MQFLPNERFGNCSTGLLLDITVNTQDNPIDSSALVTAGTNTIAATNPSFAAGQIIYLHQTYDATGTTCGQNEMNVIQSYVAGAITTKYPVFYDYIGGAQVIVVEQWQNIIVEPGVTWSAKDYNGVTGGILVKMCNGIITINGTTSVSGATGGAINGAGQVAGGATGGGFRGGHANMSVNPNGAIGQYGDGSKGPRSGGYNSGGSAGGGGNLSNGGSKSSAGAGGAGRTNASNAGGSDNPGIGGLAIGNSALTIISLGGGGGGGGAAWTDYWAHHAGGGGSGAGIIFLIARQITGTGSIILNGGNGAGADSSASGGGGAGGSLLLKGQVLSLASLTISAIHGSAGGADATDGTDGWLHADYSKTITTPTTTPTMTTTFNSTFSDSVGGGMM